MTTRHQKRVLFADDNPMVRKAVARALEAVGVDVTLAADAKQAMSLYETSAYDVVLTDYHMPDTTGVAFARDIRAKQPAQRIVMMTGLADESVNELAQTKNLNALLMKPCSFAELWNALFPPDAARLSLRAV